MILKETTKKMDILEMIIFIIAIFLQDFAVIVFQDKAGISLLVIICVFLAFRYKLISNISNYFKVFFILLSLKLIIDVLSIGTPIMSVFRIYMLIFIGYITYKYIDIIYKKNYQSIFYSIFYWSVIVITMYGLYSVVAGKFNLPLFLSVFCNNPSYLVIKSIYSYFGGGWVGSYRVFATFAEPAFYSYFLNMSFIILMNMEVSKLKKNIAYILILLNLIFTYSRSGQAVFIAILLSYSIYWIISNIFNKTFNYKVFCGAAILIPFYNILLMMISNIFIFNDMSSNVRTNSALYYLKESITGFKNILLGHGYKSLQLNYSDFLQEIGIGMVAHNGYIEIIYEFGWLIFILLICILLLIIAKIKDIKRRILILTLISAVSAFVSFYYIESFVSLVIVIIMSYINSEEKSINI
jgi:hypothetical protein